MTFGSLFAGAGGIDLGLERAGMACRWQVEINPFCQRVLAKQWPAVKRFEDVRMVGASNLEHVDLVAGGFPCQDVSRIGRMEGIDGKRSGLWVEFARIIRELQPLYVLVENVTGLLDGGIGRVLADLADIGFDAEWEVLPAWAFGGPHHRERVFIVAYAGGERLEGIFPLGTAPLAVGRGHREHAGMDTVPVLRGVSVYDSLGACPRLRMPTDRGMVERPLHGQGWWEAGPGVFRVAPGIPDRVDRIRALGNAVVPQVAEWIGRRIMTVHARYAEGAAVNIGNEAI